MKMFSKTPGEHPSDTYGESRRAFRAPIGVNAAHPETIAQPKSASDARNVLNLSDFLELEH